MRFGKQNEPDSIVPNPQAQRATFRITGRRLTSRCALTDMPALEAVRKVLQPGPPLEDVSLVLRMHGFNSVARSVGVLQRLGLKLDQVTWLQKANSAAGVETYGFDHGNFTMGRLPRNFPLVLSAAPALRLPEIQSADRYEKFLLAGSMPLIESICTAAKADGRRVGVMEDGAHLALAAARAGVSPDAIAEQTTRGRRVHEQLGLNSSVVDVAGWKAGHESPVIGFDIIEKLATRLHLNDIDIEAALSRTLIIGGGSVGSWTAARLTNLGFAPVIDDTDSDRAIQAMHLAGRNCLAVRSDAERRAAWRSASCVIECVGSPVLRTFSEWPFGRQVVLCEASSDNWGFDGILGGIWNSSPQWPFPVENARDEIAVWPRLLASNPDIRVIHEDGEALVLYCGFTINLDGSPDPIPPRLIQGTRAAMVAGIVHALRPNAPVGLSAFDREIAEVIEHAAESDLGPLMVASTPAEVFDHIECVYRESGKALCLDSL